MAAFSHEGKKIATAKRAILELDRSAAVTRKTRLYRFEAGDTDYKVTSAAAGLGQK
ncbi:hypothetical protein ACFQDN_16280 [Pseudomonas asuensis]